MAGLLQSTVTTISAGVFIAATIACGGGSTPESKTRDTSRDWERSFKGHIPQAGQTPTTVPTSDMFQASRLSREAADNEVRFGEQFGGRFLGVQGKVAAVITDEEGNKVVAIDGPTAWTVFTVRCQMAPGVSVSSLHKGDLVHVVGRCGLKPRGTIIDLLDCVWMDEEKTSQRQREEEHGKK